MDEKLLIDAFGIPFLPSAFESVQVVDIVGCQGRASHGKSKGNYLSQPGPESAINEGVCGPKKTNKSLVSESIKTCSSTRATTSRCSVAEMSTTSILPSFVVALVSDQEMMRREIHGKLSQASPETARLFLEWVVNPDASKIKQCGSWGKHSGLIRVRVDHSPWRLVFAASVYHQVLYLTELRLIMDKSTQSYRDIHEHQGNVVISESTDALGIPLDEAFSLKSLMGSLGFSGKPKERPKIVVEKRARQLAEAILKAAKVDYHRMSTDRRGSTGSSFRYGVKAGEKDYVAKVYVITATQHFSMTLWDEKESEMLSVVIVGYLNRQYYPMLSVGQKQLLKAVT